MLRYACGWFDLIVCIQSILWMLHGLETWRTTKHDYDGLYFYCIHMLLTKTQNSSWLTQVAFVSPCCVAQPLCEFATSSSPYSLRNMLCHLVHQGSGCFAKTDKRQPAAIPQPDNDASVELHPKDHKQCNCIELLHSHQTDLPYLHSHAALYNDNHMRTRHDNFPLVLHRSWHRLRVGR